MAGVKKKKQRLGEVVAQEVMKPEAKAYNPSRGAVDILEKMFENSHISDQGMTYTALRESVHNLETGEPFSDTYISKLLHHLQDHDAIDHDPAKKLYSITETGIRMLMTHRGLDLTEEDFAETRFRDLEPLVSEIHKLHEKLYRLSFPKQEPKGTYAVSVFVDPEAGLWWRIQELADRDLRTFPFVGLKKVLAEKDWRKKYDVVFDKPGEKLKHYPRRK